ncbi:PIN domain-containing protein [Geodermatophilus sp. DF01-2]|uniref:type II toxin-antitoxin system VapC family toxin n=1 Tax=Geodermatophilus sp. DF01-2 TaxID=2559610 RepID=UPI001073E8EE|nr:type II toxin-antitoxin system VapC family toxin [Geodermatophilus sp. DF01_2]TFV54589.1 PIN domain-containing protein [Geodermatophilus sp. DF01_2]
MRVYLDASAASKLLIEEAESAPLKRELDEWTETGAATVSCILLETELRRVAVRNGIDQSKVNDVLAGVDLLDLDRGLFRTAGLLPGRHLRSLDALHVAAAVRLAADVFLSYDDRQAAAAEAAGLRVLAPS